MAEEVIKTTSCCDSMMGSMLGAIANRNNDPLALMAALKDDNGDQWNNPFVYLVWMMFAQRMWGNDNNGQNAQNIELQNQIQSLRSQISDNQNSGLIMDAVKGNACAINQLASNLNCDFNALNGAICDVRQGIALLAGKADSNAEKVINSIVNGNLQMTMALKDCCCQTQQNIIKMGYENQLGQKSIENAMQQGFSYTNTGLERGFSNIGNLMQQIACDLKTNNNNGYQRIVDTLNNHWTEDLRERYNNVRSELSQERQSARIIAALKTTGTTTTPTT